jgi:hypothetical protein
MKSKSGKNDSSDGECSSDTDSADLNFPFMKEGAALFSLGCNLRNIDERASIYFPEFCYVVVDLPKNITTNNKKRTNARFDLLFNFGLNLTSATEHPTPFKQNFHEDSVINRVSILLMDTIASLSASQLAEFQTQFNDILFRPKTFDVYASPNTDNLKIEKTTRTIITSGDVRAILLGLISNKQTKTSRKWIASLDGLSQANLKRTCLEWCYEHVVLINRFLPILRVPY